MSTLTHASTDTDARLGGVICECDGCRQVIAQCRPPHGPGLWTHLANAPVYLNLDGTPHSCPTLTSVFRLTVTHSADVTADEVAKQIRVAVEGYVDCDIDSADVVCCVCGESGGGCCEFGADPDRLKAVKS